MSVIAGAGSPALLIHVLVGIELHIDWLAAMFAAMDAVDATVVEVERQAELDWGAHLTERAQETLYPKAHSYYMGAEIPGKPRGFMLYSGGLRGYRKIVTEVVAEGYRGFEFRDAAGETKKALS